MPRLLHIDSAIADDQSRSRALTRAFADAWRARGDDCSVTHRDLARDPLPHLSQRAQHWPERLRGEALDAQVDGLQRAVLDELLAADALVIGAPMYNYNIPSTLKTWVDLVHVPSITSPFGGEDTQPLRGRPAVIVTAQGGPLEPEAEHLATAPLAHLLGAAFGMNVHVVGTSRTLAEMLPDLGVDEAAAQLARATAELQRLGSEVGERHRGLSAEV